MSVEEIRRFVSLMESTLTETWDEPVRLSSAPQFATLLGRSGYGILRAFLDGTDLWVWDAGEYSHPDAVENHGLDGIPLQLSPRQIEIRLHGIDPDQYRDAYAQVVENPTIQRIYNGSLPPILSDDDGEFEQVRLDGLWDGEDGEDYDDEEDW